MNDIQLIEFLISTSDVVQRRLDRGLSFLRGISYSEYRMLSCIQSSPQQKMTRVDLASAVGLTPSAVTRALKPLEKMGYVTTERGLRDARQNLAVLTKGGEELLQDTSQAIADMVDQLPIGNWTAKQKETMAQTLSSLREKA